MKLLGELLDVVLVGLAQHSERQAISPTDSPKTSTVLPMPRASSILPIQPTGIIDPPDSNTLSTRNRASRTEPLSPDVQWLRLAPHPSVTLVLGKRDAGKSALGYRLVELNRDRAGPFVVGPASLQKLLPDWIGVVQRLEEVPHGAAVLLDEAYMTYHARATMTTEGRTIGQVVNLSRQLGLSLIFVVQEARQLDVNVISQVDVLAVKELTEISRGFERRELRRFTDEARAAFATIHCDKRRWTWVRSEKADFSGLLENDRPTFWKPALSHAFVNAGLTGRNARANIENQMGQRTPREELAQKAKHLVLAQQLSYGQAAKLMGLSKSTVWDLVNR